MRGWLRCLAVAIGVAIACTAPAGATAQGRAAGDPGGFMNVLVGGQGETVDPFELAAFELGRGPPPSFTSQIPLYKGLLYAAPTLSLRELPSFFKSAAFGLSSAQAASRAVPRPGVLILRDAHGVPHVRGRTRSDVMFGAGYASTQDRLFLMDVARHAARARLSELLGPGEDDSVVRVDSEQLKHADYSEAELRRQLDELREAGPEGAQVLRDATDYVAGVNGYIREARLDPSKLPAEYLALGKLPADWRLTDSVAIGALIGGLQGSGGGEEVLASQALRKARRRFGRREGWRVFQDFRSANDPEAPVTTRRRFPSQPVGRSRSGVALPDLGSVEERDPVVSGAGASAGAAPGSWLARLQRGIAFPETQSNAILVAGRRSRSGRPLGVMGSAVGYSAPPLLLELDLHGPGIDARGVTFPGLALYVLIGRGPNFAWALPSALTDDTDEFVERLCEPDGSAPTLASDHYLYRGRCRPLLIRDRVLTTTPNALDPSPPRIITMRVERSVHGPIQARATVAGRPVAIAEARASYMHEVQSALSLKRLNEGPMTGREFIRTMGRINLLRNWMYAGDQDIGFVQSGWFPLRATGTHPDLPSWGTGRWDWRGFNPRAFTSRRLPPSRLPHEINPRQGYLVNWNNKQAPGWRPGDGVFHWGPVNRSELLEDPLRRALRRGRKLGLAEIVRIAEDAATADLRGRKVYPWVRRVIGRPRDPKLAPLLEALDAWRASGAHRRDLNRDNVYEHSAAVALIDAWWEPLVLAVFEPVLGEELIERLRAVSSLGRAPGSQGNSFSTGWWGYVQKDLRALLGRRVRGPLSRHYCGRGSRSACRKALIASLREAASQVRSTYGPEMTDWRVPATCEPEASCDQLEFEPVGAITLPPIPWQNRPTFQQVMEVGR